MTNPHICGLCDEQKRSCCTLRVENNEGLPAPVSMAEAQRILNVFPDSPWHSLFDTRENSPQFINQITILFPDMSHFIPQVFPLDGKHLELKTKDDDCYFKGDEGCILPGRVRPHFCRIYPFWFYKDKPYLFQDSNCLALEKKQTVQEALLSLGTTPEKIKQIYDHICEDWGIFKPLSNEKSRSFI